MANGHWLVRHWNREWMAINGANLLTRNGPCVLNVAVDQHSPDHARISRKSIRRHCLSKSIRFDTTDGRYSLGKCQARWYSYAPNIQRGSLPPPCWFFSLGQVTVRGYVFEEYLWTCVLDGYTFFPFRLVVISVLRAGWSTLLLQAKPAWVLTTSSRAEHAAAVLVLNSCPTCSLPGHGR
jgi:hypothetical protein